MTSFASEVKVLTIEYTTLTSTIGIIIGKRVGNYIPAIYGIPQTATNDNLKYLGACAASSGSVALWHAVGVTPEALDRDPFDGAEPISEFTITREMLTAAYSVSYPISSQVSKGMEAGSWVVGTQHLPPMQASLPR